MLPLKIISVRITDYCTNNCPGCPIYKNERRKKAIMSPVDFEKVINFSAEYLSYKNHRPHLQLGLGNTLAFEPELHEFLGIIESIPSFYKNGMVIEFGSTLLENNDVEKIQSLSKRVNEITSDNHQIIEVIIDPLISDENLFVLKANLDALKALNYDLHIIIRYSNAFNYIEDKLNNVLSILSLKEVVVDFCFAEFAVGTKYDYLSYEKWFTNQFKKIENKTKTKIFPMHTLEMSSIGNSDPNDGFSINKELKVLNLLSTIFGDVYIGASNNNHKFVIDLNDFDNGEEAAKNLLTYEKTETVKKNIQNSIHPVCSACNLKEGCPSSLIQNFSNINDLNINKDSCMYGKKIIDFLSTV